jgi:amino acid adenylation domain-containing protein
MENVRADRLRRRIARNHGIDISEQLAAQAGVADHRTVVDAFGMLARQFGDRCAIRSGTEQLSYRQLDEASSRLAAVIQARVGPDRRPVGVLLERSAEMIVAALGAMKSGACYVPLEPTMPAARLALILEDAAPSVVVTSPGLRGTVPQGVPVLMTGDQENADWQPPAIDGSAPAYTVFTSGTTGRPKGVRVSHANLLHLVASTRQVFNYGPEDVWTTVHSFGFDYAILEIWGPLLSGGAVVVVPLEVARNPVKLRRLLQDERVSVLSQTPRAFKQLIEEDSRHAGRLPLSRVLLGGEPLRFSDLRPWLAKYGDAKPRLTNIYGPTEATVIVSYYPISSADLNDGRCLIGRPLPGTDFVLVDSGLVPVPAGTPGEIVITGPSVAIGYVGPDELTRARFVELGQSGGQGVRGYRTGDVALLTAEAEYEYRGRNDDQVKIRGYRVEPGEVEAALCAADQVAAAAVVARDLPDLGLSLVAYVVPSAADAVSPARLREITATLVPEYMVPDAFVIMAELPLTSRGKLDCHALPEPDLSACSAVSVNASRYDLEGRILDTVRALLHTEDVDPGSDFFALGGHSLLATRLLARVRSDTGVAVPLRVFFQDPTPLALAAAVRQEQAKDGPEGMARSRGLADILMTAPDPENPPLTSAQKRLYFIAELDRRSFAYHLHTTLLLDGALNIAALERAFTAVIARHVPLRTVIRVVDGEPVGRTRPATDFRLSAVELPKAPADWRQRLTEIAKAESSRPFNLQRDIMLRARLVAISPTRHALLVTMHHISADGWSIGVLTRELQAFYQRYAADPGDWSLPSPCYGYADFAYSIDQWSKSAGAEEDVGYWLSRLAALPETPMLPPDKPRPARMSYRGASLDVVAAGTAADDLRRLRREQNVTMFMLMQAAVAVLFSRRGAGPDVIFGTAVANRPLAELSELIGMFVNTVVCRVAVPEGETFSDLLDRVRRDTFDDLEHQHVPFETIVKRLNPRRSTDAMPLFQLMLVVQNNDPPALALEGMSITRFRLVENTAKVDILLEVLEHDDDIQFRWTYNTDLFAKETIAEIAGQLNQLLADLAADLDAVTVPQNVRGETGRSVFLPLRRNGGSHAPVVAIPGGLGLGSSFVQIAAHFGDRDFTALRVKDLVEALGDGLTADVLIESCTDIITGAYDRPIHLAGHSAGGTLAFHLAGRLRRRGHPVISLALLDAPGPVGPPRPAAETRASQLRSFLGLLAEVFPDAARRWRENGSDLTSGIPEAEILSRVEFLLGIERLKVLEGSLTQSFGTYMAIRTLDWPAPQPLACPALLFRAAGNSRDAASAQLAWPQALPGNIQVTDIPASHEGIMRSPYAAVLASRMASFFLSQEATAVHPVQSTLDGSGIASRRDG